MGKIFLGFCFMSFNVFLSVYFVYYCLIIDLFLFYYYVRRCMDFWGLLNINKIMKEINMKNKSCTFYFVNQMVLLSFPSFYYKQVILNR